MTHYDSWKIFAGCLKRAVTMAMATPIKCSSSFKPSLSVRPSELRGLWNLGYWGTWGWTWILVHACALSSIKAGLRGPWKNCYVKHHQVKSSFIVVLGGNSGGEEMCLLLGCYQKEVRLSSMLTQGFWVLGEHTHSYLHALTTAIKALDCTIQRDRNKGFTKVWYETNAMFELCWGYYGEISFGQDTGIPFSKICNTGWGILHLQGTAGKKSISLTTFWFHNLCLLQLFSVDITVRNWSGKFLHQESLLNSDNLNCVYFFFKRAWKSN